jgi:DNA-binding transcriptional MerR regulator
MGGVHGTKETKDWLYVGKVVVLNILREARKDGFQMKDIGAFLKSPEFEGALREAIKDTDKVDEEILEMDFFDGLDIARYGYSMMDDILGEFRALAAAKKAT